ncbi:MAG: DNA-directed DNA polymerase [Candidatus Rickettsia vulgarisii]
MLTLQNHYLTSNKLNWLYIDINSYFATVEQQINPKLRGKPIVVVPVLSDTTCAIAASHEAKLKGIKTGTRIYDAKKLCPDLICIPARHELYVKYHKEIFSEIDKILCVDHIFSIDEGCCRLTGKYCNEEEATKIALQIKEVIKKNVGDYITCSIGISSNRYLAKVATNLKKPDGLIVISPNNIQNLLSSITLKDLPGIGYSTYQRLIAYNIDSVEKLYRLNSKQLKTIWGNIWGEKVYYLIRGTDLPFEERKSATISHSQVLAPDLRAIESARNILLSLTLRAANRLRAKNLATSSILLFITTGNSKYLKARIKVEFTSDSVTLSNAALKCWDNLLSNNQTIEIRKVAICFTNVRAQSTQLDFFNLNMSNDIGNNRENNLTKKNLLSSAIDEINNKYGRGTISLGQIPERHKQEPIVAFGYIPENDK